MIKLNPIIASSREHFGQPGKRGSSVVIYRRQRRGFTVRLPALSLASVTVYRARSHLLQEDA